AGAGGRRAATDMVARDRWRIDGEDQRYLFAGAGQALCHLPRNEASGTIPADQPGSGRTDRLHDRDIFLGERLDRFWRRDRRILRLGLDAPDRTGAKVAAQVTRQEHLPQEPVDEEPWRAGAFFFHWQ